MSRSRRRVKKDPPGRARECSCWFCDNELRVKTHNDKRSLPDPEQAQEIQETKIKQTFTGV